MNLPPKPFLRGILVRTTLVWAFLHAVGVAGAAGMRVSPAATFLPGIAAFWIWGVTGVVVLAAMNGRGESLLLANLGHSRREILALVVGWCAVMDAGLVALMVTA